MSTLTLREHQSTNTCSDYGENEQKFQEKVAKISNRPSTAGLKQVQRKEKKSFNITAEVSQQKEKAGEMCITGNEHLLYGWK